MKRYKHYKGNIYEFVTVAIHTETKEKLVIYKNETGETFARPYDMFYGMVEKDGKKMRRFSEYK